jgi:ABC-type ATPase involved in cell division
MAAEILEALKDIGSGGTTIVLATHQARLAAALKRRTVTLDAGHVVKDEG